MATKTVTARIAVGVEPEGVINSVDGKTVFVTSEVADTVHVIDIASLEVTEVLFFLPPGFRAEDVTPVGMAVTADDITVVDMASLRPAVAVPVGRTPQSIRIDDCCARSP